MTAAIRSALFVPGDSTPKLGKALFVDLGSGGKACLMLPGLRHFVFFLQGLRWIEALFDPSHGGDARVAFGNVHDDILFKFIEQFR